MAPRAGVRVYARVLVPPNLYIKTYIHLPPRDTPPTRTARPQPPAAHSRPLHHILGNTQSHSAPHPLKRPMINPKRGAQAQGLRFGTRKQKACSCAPSTTAAAYAASSAWRA